MGGFPRCDRYRLSAPVNGRKSPAGGEPGDMDRLRPRPASVLAAALSAAAMMALLLVATIRTPAGATTTAGPATAAGGSNQDAVPAWEPQARAPFPGGPRNQLNIWLRQGQAQSQALPREHPPVLFVGDSITQWWRTNGRVTWDRWFAPLGAADDGVVGDTTSNLLARIDACQVPSTSPRVIVLSIGTNNIALGQSPHQIVKGIEAVISALHRRMPASRMVVLGLLPRDHPGDAYRAETVAVNRLLERALRHTGAGFLRYLDVGPVLLQPDGRFKPGVMLADLLHPSPAGYALIGPPIVRAIAHG